MSVGLLIRCMPYGQLDQAVTHPAGSSDGLDWGLYESSKTAGMLLLELSCSIIYCSRFMLEAHQEMLICWFIRVQNVVIALNVDWVRVGGAGQGR